MVELQLELRKGDISVKIKGASPDEVLLQFDAALSLLQSATEKLKEKKIEIPTVPTFVPSIEVPNIGAPPPAGCRDAIVRLLSTDWGRVPKTLGEIMEALKINGIYYPKARVASELLIMTRTGIARRLKTKTGFAYILAKPV